VVNVSAKMMDWQRRELIRLLCGLGAVLLCLAIGIIALFWSPK
jgi:hypothetical protein